MTLYNVIPPCIVNGMHYTRPSRRPVEASDAEAAPLVESGNLVPMPAAVISDGGAEVAAPAPNPAEKRERPRRGVRVKSEGPAEG